MIYKAFHMQYIVDLYGDAPYSQAWNVLIPTPIYDEQETIYRELYNSIDDAIALIENADNDVVVGSEDAIYGGDMQQWINFANTLKLRYLIRQSEVSDGEISSFVSSEI